MYAEERDPTCRCCHGKRGGGEDGSWMGVMSAANEVKHQHAMKAFQLLSPSTVSNESQRR